MNKSLTKAIVVLLCVATGLAVTLYGVVGSGPASAKPTANGLSLHATDPDKPDGLDSSGDLWGWVTNLTPYTLTYVAQGVRSPGEWFNNGNGELPQTVEPGQSFAWELRNYSEQKDILGGHMWLFSGWITYKADVVNGSSEYLTVSVGGCDCSGTFHGDWPYIRVRVFNTTGPPKTFDDSHRYGYDPINDQDILLPSGSYKTKDQQIDWDRNGTVNDNNVYFQVKGNFTVDAAKDPPALADVLNSMCAGADHTSCSFTQTGPLTWGLGGAKAKKLLAQSANCVLSKNAARVTDSAATPPPPPPTDDQSWHEYSVEESQTATLGVGGSLSASAETEVLGVIGLEVEAKVGIQHEWSTTTSLTKTTRVYMPDNYLSSIWIAPEVGTVKGTLVVSTDGQDGKPLATYTITNFTETRSGVTRDADTPAFDIITDSRPLTAAERSYWCRSLARSREPLHRPGSRSH